MESDDIENEGAIDTGDDTQQTAQGDNSGAAPVSGGAIDTDDNSGAPPVMPPQQSAGAAQPQEQQSRSGVDLNAAHVPGNMKKIISYLMGADAAHPQTIDQAGSAIDPQGQMHPADRNVLAIEKAREQGGDQAAWALMQANRVAYNAQTAFAKTALEGTQQKPADLRAAIDAANKAQANVLDGSQITFAPGQTGVTAMVNMPGTKASQQIQLTPQQFGQFLDVGGDGQWDKVMEHSAPATLTRIAQSGGQAPAGQRPGQPTVPLLQQPKAPRPAAAPAAAPQEDQQPAEGSEVTPGKVTRREYQQPEYSGNLDDTQKREQASYQMFPRAHLDERENAKRVAWVQGQEGEDANRANKIDVAGETGKQRLKVANATGDWHQRVAETNSEAKLKGWQYSSDAKLKTAQAQIAAKVQQQESANANASQTRALKAIQTKLMSAQSLTPQEQQYMDSLPAAGQAGAQVTRPGQHAQQQAPQAPQSGQQRPPVPGAKLYNGQWYTRGPNGESVPVQ